MVLGSVVIGGSLLGIQTVDQVFIVLTDSSIEGKRSAPLRLSGALM